jgi:hypothetical protein
MERCRDRHCRRGAAALLFGLRRPGAPPPVLSSRPRTQPACAQAAGFFLARAVIRVTRASLARRLSLLWSSGRDLSGSASRPVSPCETSPVELDGAFSPKPPSSPLRKRAPPMRRGSTEHSQSYEGWSPLMENDQTSIVSLPIRGRHPNVGTVRVNRKARPPPHRSPAPRRQVRRSRLTSGRRRLSGGTSGGNSTGLTGEPDAGPHVGLPLRPITCRW